MGINPEPKRECSAFDSSVIWPSLTAKPKGRRDDFVDSYFSYDLAKLRAKVRREISVHQISFMSRPSRDSIEIPRHIWHRMENALAHANSAFDYATKLMEARSLSEWIELTTAHAREQLDVLAEQSKKLTLLAQKVANETAEPIKEGMTKAFKQAA